MKKFLAILLLFSLFICTGLTFKAKVNAEELDNKTVEVNDYENSVKENNSID